MLLVEFADKLHDDRWAEIASFFSAKLSAVKIPTHRLANLFLVWIRYKLEGMFARLMQSIDSGCNEVLETLNEVNLLIDALNHLQI